MGDVVAEQLTIDGGAERVAVDADQQALKGALDSATKELCGMLKSSSRRWADVYGLMDKVQREGLWKAEHASFTAWVKAVAKAAGIQVSYLWRVKKAGAFYSEYAARAAAAGKSFKPLEQLEYGDELMADVATICGRDKTRADRLMGGITAGELSKKDVKRMLGAHRACAGRRADGQGGTDAGASAGAEGGAVTAEDILIAVKPAAIVGADALAALPKPLRAERRVFDVLAEFPVLTGTSDHARRMDALVVTNAATAAGTGRGCSQYGVDFHCIEIKVAASDLERDEKHLEYQPFADYCWFAVPKALADRATEIADAEAEGWGVLVYDEAAGELRRAVPAARNAAPVMRGRTAETVLVKRLSAL